MQKNPVENTTYTLLYTLDTYENVKNINIEIKSFSITKIYFARFFVFLGFFFKQKW